MVFKDKIRVHVSDRVSNKVTIGIRVSAFYTGSLQKPALSNLPAFLPRDAMLSAVYAVIVCLCVCAPVCLCVCLSHCGIVSKRLNIGSRK